MPACNPHKLVAEFDGLTGYMTKSYTWNPQADHGVGGLLSITTYSNDSDHAITGIYNVISNAHGDIVALIDAATSAVVETYTYSAFGVRTASGSADVCPFGFDGYYLDPDTGIYAAGSGTRWYDADMGVFLQPDPSGQQNSLNTRVYAHDDPINRIDTNGMADESISDQVLGLQIGPLTQSSGSSSPSEGGFTVVGPELAYRMQVYDTYMTTPSRDSALNGNFWAGYAANRVTIATMVQQQGLAATLQNDNTWGVIWSDLGWAMNPYQGILRRQQERAQNSTAIGAFVDAYGRYGLSAEIWIGSHGMDNQGHELLGIVDNQLYLTGSYHPVAGCAGAILGISDDPILNLAGEFAGKAIGQTAMALGPGCTSVPVGPGALEAVTSTTAFGPVTAIGGSTLALTVGDAGASWNAALFQEFRSVAPYQNFYDVIGHSDGRLIGVMESDGAINASTLARRIFNAADYTPGQPIRLLACWGGVYDDGLAAQLSAELTNITGQDTVVVGATFPVGAIDGRILMTIPKPGFRIPGPVRWRFFNSQGPLMDSLGPYLP